MAWSSKRQYCVAKYIMEVEYIACRTITSQAVWINRFAEFRCTRKSIDMYFDNKAAIYLITSGPNSF